MDSILIADADIVIRIDISDDGVSVVRCDDCQVDDIGAQQA